MPSDIPPIRQAPPVATGTAPPSAAMNQGGQGADKPARQPPAPSILNPALRRHWHRESGGQEAPRSVRRHVAQQAVFWAILLGVLVGAALIFDRGIAVVEAPRPRLGPVETVPVPRRSAVAPPPVVAARPEVIYAYGNGAVVQAAQLARRYGEASAYAVTCGRQTPAWPGAVSAELATDITGRMPMFENNPRVLGWMKEFIQAQFHDGQLVAEHGLAVRGKAAVCAELPLSSDYAGAQRVVRDSLFRQQ